MEASDVAVSIVSPDLHLEVHDVTTCAQVDVRQHCPHNFLMTHVLAFGFASSNNANQRLSTRGC